MTFHTLLPAGWATPVGYANGIEAPAGRMIFIAGQIGWDAQQRLVGPDLVAQFAQALRNIIGVVGEAGGKPEHVCRITAFCVDKKAYVAARRELGRAWRDIMGKHYPVMSLIFVADLLEDGAKIELEATAVIPH